MDNEELYCKYLSGELSEIEKEQLKIILKNDSRPFFEFMEHSALFVEAAENLQDMSQSKALVKSEPQGRKSPRKLHLQNDHKQTTNGDFTVKSQGKYIIGALAALFIVSFSIFLLFPHPPAPEIAKDKPTSVNKNNSIVSLPKNDTTNPVPKNDTTNPVPKSNTLVSVPKDKILEPLIKPKSTNKVEHTEEMIAKKIPTQKVSPKKDPIPTKKLSTKTLAVFATLKQGAVGLSIDRSGQSLTATDGMKLRQGDILSKDYGHQAIITCQDGTEIKLAEASSLSLKMQQGAKILHLQGRAHFNVKPQKKAMLVISAECRLTVLGTSFDFESYNKKSRIDLHKGRVSITDSKNKVTTLKPGESLFANNIGTFKSLYNQQYGYKVAELSSEDRNFRASNPSWDITTLLNRPGVYDFYFKQQGDDKPLKIKHVSFFKDNKLHSRDEHSSLTVNHLSKDRSRGIWKRGNRGANMYRLVLKKAATGKWTINPRYSKSSNFTGSLWMRYTDISGSTISFPAASSGKNLALRKKTQSNRDLREHSSSLANDGKINPASSWGSVGSPHWQVDLASIKEFSQIHLYDFWENNRYSGYIIEVSDDKQKWQRIIDMSDTPLPAHFNGTLHKFPSIKARYVRLKILSTIYGGTSIVEVKILK
ncbi:MAG: discoidin domain-containing protein [Lentisphaeraceae bacterium]|nr:discoidin domain-containing protein [Lentisphaeraceae bacterium]